MPVLVRLRARGAGVGRGPVPEAPPTTWAGSSWCLRAACWHRRSQLPLHLSCSQSCILPCPLSDTRGSPWRTVTPGSQRGSLWGSRFLGLLGSYTYWQGAIAVCVRVSAPAVGFLRLGACRVWGALLEPSVAPGCPLHTHTLGLIFSSSLPCSQPRSLQAAQAPGGQAHCPGLPWVVPTLSPPATLAQGPHVRPVDPN